jgi:catechol 2,3-dioxygenase-like lactoylglutathione lyase family enzyme
MIEGISAVTLGTHEMPRAVRFYRALGFEVLHGGEESSFTSFRAGTSYLNLIAQPAERRWSWWGRVIFYVADVDALYDRALAAGYQPATVPHDAEWGERFFHLVNPTATNSVSLGLCSRFPSNSRSKRPAIPRGAGRA